MGAQVGTGMKAPIGAQLDPQQPQVPWSRMKPSASAAAPQIVPPPQMSSQQPQIFGGHVPSGARFTPQGMLPPAQNNTQPSVWNSTVAYQNRSGPQAMGAALNQWQPPNQTPGMQRIVRR